MQCQSYKSVHEALNHAGLETKTKVNINGIDRVNESYTEALAITIQ